MDLSNAFSQQWLSLPVGIFILLVLTLVISALGFYRTVFFISIGYAFSITAMTLVTVAALNKNLTWISILQNGFLLVWSLRLGLYLLRRELLPAYKPQQQRNQESTVNVTRKAQFFIWVSVSLLYVAMFSPSLFTLSVASINISPAAALVGAAGLVIMFGGLALEWTADKQKSDFKAHFPKAFCNVGLYRYARCPNYLGEILFWVGNWVVALGFYTSLLQVVISLIGMICIVLIMIGSTKRLEESQDERYSSLPEYQTYIRTIPVLIPFIPVYTLKNVRVYLG